MRAVETTPTASLNAGEELSLHPREVGDLLARPQGNGKSRIYTRAVGGPAGQPLGAEESKLGRNVDK